MRLLVQAQKAQRLYDRKNAISEKIETDIFSRLSEFLDPEKYGINSSHYAL